PLGVYSDVKWKVITAKEGDVFAKAVVRVLEVLESVKIIRQCVELLKKNNGEISVEVRDIPPGEGIGRYEAPRGETFHYVRSDGTNRPVRHKVRAPSYNNIPTCKATCIGEQIADVTLITAAVDPCYSCTDRVSVIRNGRNESLTGDDLIRMSIEKTRKIANGMGYKGEELGSHLNLY
ncbi:MAG: NADH:ubiquinone oxidoreductase, partial [Actinomycetia bacterium]|nr:NADH:ubiquinone oxidoreductase [Actinomycetes bacterium]